MENTTPNKKQTVQLGDYFNSPTTCVVAVAVDLRNIQNNQIEREVKKILWKISNISHRKKKRFLAYFRVK